METVEREVAKLLVELTFAAAQRRFPEAGVLLGVLEYLVADPQDLQISQAYVHLKLGDVAQATACLGNRDDDSAKLVAQWILESQSAGPAPRLVL
jgi:hypothetical protein